MESVLENVAAAGPTPEGTTAHHQLRRELQRAIRSLSPKLRDALLLAQSGEYSYDEIGDDAEGAGRDDQVARVRSAARRAGDDCSSGATSMSDERLDRLIDEVARQMTAGQPSSDFRARVVAQPRSPAGPRLAPDLDRRAAGDRSPLRFSRCS